MSAETWRETRQTLWDMILYRLFRVVRLKHHDQLLDRYCRLTAQYIAMKSRADELAAKEGKRIAGDLLLNHKSDLRAASNKREDNES